MGVGGLYGGWAGVQEPGKQRDKTSGYGPRVLGVLHVVKHVDAPLLFSWKLVSFVLTILLDIFVKLFY